MESVKITKKHHNHLNNPFPAHPKCVPLIHGNLLFNSHSVPSQKIFSIGKDFQLLWTSKNGGSLSIFHNSHLTKPMWSTIPGRPFVSAALAETEVNESRGSFLIKDTHLHLLCVHQSIEDIRIIDDVKFPSLVISGWIFSKKTKKRPSSSGARYFIVFDQKSSNQVGFQLKLGGANFQVNTRRKRRRKRKLGWRWSLTGERSRGFAAILSSVTEEETEMSMSREFNRLCFIYSSESNERFYGFGEQFSHMDFKGKRVPIFVQEQGIGRGDQPITFAANLVSYRAGGDWSTTYAPSPFYITSKMRSVYLEGYDYSIFDLTTPDRVRIQIHGNSLQGRILYGNTPSELIECFTETIGRPPELPEWIISGAVAGMQGGTDAVLHVWDALRTHEVPVSAFWLQDWVGQRSTLIGSQLWWNWEVDTKRYQGWQQLIKDLSAQHIKVMTYCNPCLAPVDEKPNKRRNLFDEAKKLGILVKDKHGEPYMVPNTAFDVGMLDLTHPDTASWFKHILQEMVDDGVRGWMADFGEGLPIDATLYSGEDPISAHNRYPELWAQMNREFVEEWKGKCLGKGRAESEEGLVFFMRAGFRESPKWGMLFWEGDQMVSWQANDGIKSAVIGLLSSGLSGYAFNHSDIGGYCAVNLPLIKYRRSEELLLRWMELNAFTTIFRTHEGNKPSCNTQFYSNHQTLSHFARFAKVYKAWKFYRIQLVKEAAEKGLPVCRHLFLHYPDDERVQRLSYHQFLVGTEILVVPTLDKGKKKVRAYFPVGESRPWQHVWTGKIFTRHGCDAWVAAPIGYPAVFVKAGSLVGETFLKNLINYEIL
ncbi:sulfoquinovosidase-like [Mangifera indica]|uniref:sulfoquinovosidase-like n=1 Tax=Mangifera indica TaxID=29780 RepID=UPI001CFA6119|nr:sulfoquinovosidase-like [Mangifera indica]